MKNDRSIDLGLTGYEELFMSTEERLDAKKPKVEAIPLSDLTPFRNHPFKVKEDEEMAQLMRSIADAGVLSPALARPLPDGGYELISGHRRLAACKALGIDTMPVIIRDLTDEEAVITMVDSNLQREHILPSEKAFAYKMKMEALKNQGKRTDLTLSQVATKLDAAAEIGKSADESRDQVFRYIRLTNLIPDILKLVDEGKIALTPAVELSYLQPSEQEMLFSVMDSDEVTPSLSQARRLRRIQKLQQTDEGKEHTQAGTSVAVCHPVGNAGGMNVLVDATVSPGDQAQAQASGGPLRGPEPDVGNTECKTLTCHAEEVSGTGKGRGVRDRRGERTNVAGTGGIGLNRRNTLGGSIAQCNHGNDIDRCQYDKINHALSPIFLLFLLFLGNILEREVHYDTQQHSHACFKNEEPVQYRHMSHLLLCSYQSKTADAYGQRFQKSTYFAALAALMDSISSGTTLNRSPTIP